MFEDFALVARTWKDKVRDPSVKGAFWDLPIPDNSVRNLQAGRDNPPNAVQHGARQYSLRTAVGHMLIGWRLFRRIVLVKNFLVPKSSGRLIQVLRDVAHAADTVGARTYHA